jgi:hypothetical protein
MQNTNRTVTNTTAMMGRLEFYLAEGTARRAADIVANPKLPDPAARAWAMVGGAYPFRRSADPKLAIRTFQGKVEEAARWTATLFEDPAERRFALGYLEGVAREWGLGPLTAEAAVARGVARAG